MSDSPIAHSLGISGGILTKLTYQNVPNNLMFVDDPQYTVPHSDDFQMDAEGLADGIGTNSA